MKTDKLLKRFGIFFSLIGFFVLFLGYGDSWFLTEGSVAAEPKPQRFEATFQGWLTNFDFKTKSISVEGNASGPLIGDGTFKATGTFEDWNTASGTVTVYADDGSTITADLIGYRTGQDSFAGTYRVTSGTGRFQTATGGFGVVSGTFDLENLTFQGQAKGTIIY